MIGQSAHLDLDWLEVFTTNVRNDPPARKYWFFRHPENGVAGVTNDIFQRVSLSLLFICYS